MTSSADDLDPSSPQFWMDLFTDDSPSSSAEAPPTGDTSGTAMGSAPPPQHTGVRPRTVIDAAIAHHDTPMLPAKMSDGATTGTDSSGGVTSTMQAVREAELLALKHASDGVVQTTLRPGEERQTEDSGLPQSQGIPGAYQEHEEAPRETLRGHAIPPAALPQLASSPWAHCATPLYIESPAAVAAVEAELPTVRPPTYAEQVDSFRAAAQSDNLTLHSDSELAADADSNAGREPFIPRPPQMPRMELPPEAATEQPDDEEAPTTIPSPPPVEPSAPAVAIVDITPPDATNNVAADTPALPTVSSRIRWMDAARQHPRSIAIGGILLALVSLSLGVWYLADNWWYYNPF